MIVSILAFSLKSAICSAIFAAYYLLILRNAQMNTFNRFYLLSAALLSLLLPFAQFQIFNIAPVAVADFPLLNISGKGTEETITNVAATDYVDWRMILSAAYFIVASILVLRIAARLIWVYNLKKQGQVEIREDFTLIKTEDPRAPFSFMNTLFWPTHMREDSAEGKDIMMHELAHIKQYHTIDKILMQLIVAVCWLNPFNWLLKKEIWLQHEFLADRYAIKDGNSETFAKMLLYSVTNANKSIISPFFQSPVKRRLQMLTQPSKGSFGILRRFLSIPILFTAIVLMAADTAHTSPTTSTNKIVLVLDAAHGGEDVGGKSIYGQQEKDITLALCKKLVLLSKEYNVDIITTRFEDVAYTLEERVNTSNATNNAIFLSIHVNKSTSADVGGNNYELGINPKSKNYDKSILLASSLANKLKAQQLPVKVVDHSKVYVIRENRHPALIMECGNLDDADNMALLSDEARKEALCRNILSGIVDYNAKLATK